MKRARARRRTSRPCYVCGWVDNPVVAEEPIQFRLGRPVLPESTYVFVRCHRCSTLYVDSEVSDEYLLDLYASETVESVAEVTGGLSHEAIVAPRLPEFRVHWADIKKYRGVRRGDQLLDIGCQTGEFGELALRDGVRPNGIELSDAYAATARKLWGDRSHVHSGTVDAAPFANGQFAYITSFETLEHVCDPVTTLRKIRRWLAEDGVLAVSVPSSDYFHLKYWTFRKSPLAPLLSFRKGSSPRAVLPHTHIYNFSPTSLRLLLGAGGFHPLHVSPTGWHGPTASAANAGAKRLSQISQGRVALAPSLFAIADLGDADER